MHRPAALGSRSLKAAGHQPVRSRREYNLKKRPVSGSAGAGSNDLLWVLREGSAGCNP